MVTTPGTKVKTSLACPRIVDFNPPLEHQYQFSEKDYDWVLDGDGIEPCKFDSGKVHVLA